MIIDINLTSNFLHFNKDDSVHITGLKNKEKSNYYKTKLIMKQECIPVGCVPSAAVAVSWGRWGLTSTFRLTQDRASGNEP